MCSELIQKKKNVYAAEMGIRNERKRCARKEQKKALNDFVLLSRSVLFASSRPLCRSHLFAYFVLYFVQNKIHRTKLVFNLREIAWHIIYFERMR